MPNRLAGGPQSSSDDLYTKIALDNKLITRYHLRQASKEQEDLAEAGQNVPLGVVMVRMGFLTEGQHQSVINACRYREQRDYDKRFARQILRMELLPQSSIEESLEVQKREYGQSGVVAPLADGLENAGKLTSEQVEAIHKGIQQRDKSRTKGAGATGRSPLAVSGPTPVLGARAGEDDPTVEGSPLAGQKPGEEDVDLDDLDLDDIDADLDDADLDDADLDDLDDADLDDADLDDADLDDLDLDDLDDADLDDVDLDDLDDEDLEGLESDAGAVESDSDDLEDADLASDSDLGDLDDADLASDSDLGDLDDADLDDADLDDADLDDADLDDADLDDLDLDDLDLDDADLDDADLDDADLDDVDLDDLDLDDLEGDDLEGDDSASKAGALDEDESDLAALNLDDLDEESLDAGDSSEDEDEEDLAQVTSELDSEVQLDAEDIRAMEEFGSAEELEGAVGWAAEAFDDRPLGQRPPSERMPIASASLAAPPSTPPLPRPPTAPTAPTAPTRPAPAARQPPQPPAPKPEPVQAKRPPKGIPGGSVFDESLSDMGKVSEPSDEAPGVAEEAAKDSGPPTDMGPVEDFGELVESADIAPEDPDEWGTTQAESGTGSEDLLDPRDTPSEERRELIESAVTSAVERTLASSEDMSMPTDQGEESSFDPSDPKVRRAFESAVENAVRQVMDTAFENFLKELGAGDK